jgi:hypothetical protein
MAVLRKKWGLILLGICVAPLLFGKLVVPALNVVQRREAQRQAERWLQEAQKFAQPSLSWEEASSWLEQNGADHVYVGRSAHWDEQTHSYCQVVRGERRYADKIIWTDELTIVLEFRIIGGKGSRVTVEVK